MMNIIYIVLFSLIIIEYVNKRRKLKGDKHER